MFQLFGGDERRAKRAVWLRDWRKIREQIAYIIDYAEPEGKVFERLRRLAVLAVKGPASRRMLFEVRCDRGGQIARTLGFSESTAAAIRSMDEHWDGGGYPDGLRREKIPMLARIIGLAQVAEIFATEQGRDRAAAVVRPRLGSWFDPEVAMRFRASPATSRSGSSANRPISKTRSRRRSRRAARFRRTRSARATSPKRSPG